MLMLMLMLGLWTCSSGHRWRSHLQCCLSFPAGMYGLPRPWYFPLQRCYWSGSGRVESWDGSWWGGGATRLSVMEEDQACALDQRRSGMKGCRCWWRLESRPDRWDR